MANPIADVGLNNLIIEPEPEPDEEPQQPPKKKKMTKAEKKEKKRQRQIANKKQTMLREFQAELELSRRTAKKLQQNWKDTISDMKLTELKDEIMVWEQKTMRQFHEKDEHIQNMISYMNLVEETNHAINAQLTGYFHFIKKVYHVLRQTCKRFYEEGASEIFIEFENELSESKDVDNFNRLNCENIMHTTNLIFENMMLKDYNIFVEVRNNNVNTEIEKRYCIRENVVKKMRAAQQQLVDFVNEITASPLDSKKYERIRNAMNRQNKLNNVYKALEETEKRQRRQYNDLKLELLEAQISAEKKTNELLLERSYFKEIRKAIEKNIKCNREETFQKLTIVASESYAVVQHFEKIRQYGELLLSTAASIRKYQTEAEKVLICGHFPTLKENPSEVENLRKFVLTVINPSTHLDRSDEEFYNELNLLRVFYHRFLIAEMQKGMLEEEKRQLIAENKKYTDFICSLSDEQRKIGKGQKSLIIHCIEPKVLNCPENIESREGKDNFLCL